MNYYNGADVLNADKPFNFICSNRTAGKTFYWSRYCVKEFLEKGHMFIYLRRNENDVKMAGPEFFNDIQNKFPGWHMEFKGNKFFIGHLDADGEWTSRDCCGYAFSLNTIKKLKSVPLSKVCTIFYDEFLPDDMRFLHPSEPTYEPNMLLSVYMTVARGYKRVIREEVKLICCANVVSRFNPYFSVFGINLARSNKYKSKSIYARILHNKEVAQALKESNIGELLERTTYGRYALDNIPLADVNSGIAKHKKNDRAFLNLHFFDTWYIAYFSLEEDSFIFAKGYDKTLKRKYKIDDAEGLDDIPYFTGQIYRDFKDLAGRSKVKYESMEIKVQLAGFLQPTIQK